MSTEVRHEEVGYVKVAGVKVDTRFSIANILQIGAICMSAFFLWRQSDLAEQTRIKEAEKTELVVQQQLREQLTSITVMQVRLDKMDDNRAAILDKNDARLAAIQSILNSHESRLNVDDTETVAIRDRISEIFDELRSIKGYLIENNDDKSELVLPRDNA